MNKKNLISNIQKILLVVFCSAFIFSACENEEFDTNSLSSKEITLKAFGPNPALRGQRLSFAGTNLDKITKVILPNNIEITDIEVIDGKLIKVLVPQETVAGIIKLIGPNNLELSSKDSLTISEPIEITKMTPQPIKAGQVLTIEGNYFNLIEKVIFSDKVEIEGKDFIKWERTKIELALPAEAQTGIVILANNDPIPLEYQTLEPLQVVLPSVNEVLDLTDKKPGEEIATAGKDLDLVVKVAMPNGTETPFTVENDALKFTLPNDVSDGAIVMIPASGVQVVIANIGVAMPAQLKITPSEELRDGDEITITGINLELVTTIQFPGVDEAVAPSSQSATEIKVKMPEKATSGELQLNTASGKTVPLAIVTQKPDLVSYSPKPAPGGSDVVLQGRNLDLVVAVTFTTVTDSVIVEVAPSAPDNLTVTVPLNAVSGKFVLTMANGETVESTLEITAPLFAYIPNPPGPKAEIHAGSALSLEIENGDKLTDVQINGISAKYILDAPKLYIAIPNNARGNTELKLVSSNGEAVYTIPVIGAGIIETVIWEGLYELNWGEPVRLNKEYFENVPAGSKMKVTLSTIASDASIAFSDANWTKLTIDHPNFDPQWGTVSLPEGTTEVEFVLTADILHTILEVSDGWSQSAILLTGAGAIVSKVSIFTGSAPAETVISEETVDFGNWANTLRIYKESFEGVRAGTILKLYYTATAENPQFALQDAAWSKVAIPDDPNFDPQWGSVSVPADGTTYEIVLTQAILDVILNVSDGWSTTAIIFGGQNMIVSKVTLIN
ncbi:MAG: hypothetical protein LBP83_03770 [Dysgonamonadaceae bacterium]|jgi:hypothetical protein|nr:hypothetical protein [Dysgonamonadaceae bacterium]